MSDSTPNPSEPTNAQPTPPPPPAAPIPPGPGASGSVPQNGMGTAALVLGIVQFICLGPIASILAIIFGAIGVKKANRGEATNKAVAMWGLWLGIIGTALFIIGGIVTVILISAGVIMAASSIDPANNAKTGLSDGGYAMSPNGSLRINERCSFSGKVASAETQEVVAKDVTVVGEGPTECAGTGTPKLVTFVVSGGVAKIVGVN